MLNKHTIHTNVLGLARSLIAIHLLLDLAFTKTSVFFPTEIYNSNSYSDAIIPNFFELFGTEYRVESIIIACSILVAVIIGYLPQLTSLLHAWIAYSFFSFALFIEGGHQLAQILTIFLIPICLFDKRLNHWSTDNWLKYRDSKFINFTSRTFYFMIAIQMSIVYFFAVTNKMAVGVWTEGSAIYYWLNDSIFGINLVHNSIFDALLKNKFFVTSLTWFTLLLESTLFAALLVGKKKKKIILLFGILFHLLIAIIHGLWSFSFVMFGGLILYLYPVNQHLNFNSLKNHLPRFRLPS